MRHPFRAFELADMVVHVAQAQIDDGPVPGRDICRARMDQVAVEQHRRAGLALGRYHAAFIDQPGDRFLVDGPERVAGGLHIMARLQDAGLVAARDKHQRAIEFGDVLQEQRNIHGARFGHHVVS